MASRLGSILKNIGETIVVAIGIALIIMLFIGNSDGFWQNFIINFSLAFLISLGGGYIADMPGVSWIENPVRRFIQSFVLTVIYTFFVAAFVVVMYGMIAWEYDPVTAFRLSNWEYYLSVLIITTIIALFAYGRTFLIYWRKAAVEAEQLKQAQISAQYESLKNQVNPHFLFNSLNVLSTLVYKDQDLAARFIKQLSTVYRYVLDTQEKEVVPFQTELDALESYVFLLKIRFGESLHMSIDLPNMEDKFIAPLTLQMLVENAVKHNVVSKESPLHIRIWQSDDATIQVENNLQKKSNRQSSIGVGLPNIKKRYQFLTNRNIEIHEEQGHYAVHIPIIEMTPA